jgi:DNA-binding CsgD family transcriptional regulator
LNSDEDALAGVKLPTVVETHHHSSDGIHEVHAGGWLRDGAIVLLELRRRSPFGDGERRQIRRIVAHLARVVRTRSKIRHTETAEQQSRAALNVLRVPAAIVDAKCAVLARNRLFDRVIERGTLELGVDNRVRGARPSLTGRLRDNICCIADGGGSGEPEEDSSELTVVLDARPQHRTTIVARPITLADATTPRVLLSVYHPDADHSIDHELLEQLYDFTPTEAQTAARLAEGYTIDEIADFRRCAKSTVRTHVKRILQKTGTHRQAELVRVILGSPAAKLTAWGA